MGNGFLEAAQEREESTKLRGDVGDVLVRFLRRECLERLLEPFDSLGKVTSTGIDLGQAG